MIKHDHSTFQTCEPNDDGSLMICASPNIKPTSYPITPQEAIPVHVHFHMDGVLNLTNFAHNNPEMSEFSYHVDPQFYGFDGGSVRYFYQYETDLAILVSWQLIFLGVNPLNAIGANVLQVLMLTEIYMAMRRLNKVCVNVMHRKHQ